MTATNINPLFITEPAEVYHKKAAENLSSHALSDFRHCPLLFYKKKAGLIPDKDRPAYILGRATHTLILEGTDQFDSEYLISDGPENEKTGKPYGSTTKAYQEWAKAQTRAVLTENQGELVHALNASVQTHTPACELLDEGVAEAVVRVDYCGVPCQIRMDWFNPERGIVDLKTCDNLTWFESDARRYNYIHQLAFYRAVLGTATGTFHDVHIIAVEKNEPYRCGVWKLGSDVLAMAQKHNEAAIKRLKKCAELSEWPTGYEDVRSLDYLA